MFWLSPQSGVQVSPESGVWDRGLMAAPGWGIYVRGGVLLKLGVMATDHVLEVPDIVDGKPQCLHFGQSLVFVFMRDNSPEPEEGRVDGLDPPPLPGVPPGHQLGWLILVGDVFT